jgi:hypothetical protein
MTIEKWGSNELYIARWGDIIAYGFGRSNAINAIFQRIAIIRSLNAWKQ